MNPDRIGELLDRAAESITPAEIDPASRMAELGRRSVRRRRAWAAAGAVAAAVTAAVTLPLAVAGPLPAPEVAGPTTVTVDEVSVAVPRGWKVKEAEFFDPCTAEKSTVYVSDRFDLYRGMPSEGPGARYDRCKPATEPWIGVVRRGVAAAINPQRTVIEDGQLLAVEPTAELIAPHLWTYRAMNGEIEAPGVFLPGDDQQRGELLELVTWSGGPTTPASGGLVLPDHITSVMSFMQPSNGMTVATDKKTVEQVRKALAGLRDPVPAGEECALDAPEAVSINLGEITVLLGDASCPQATSTGGGRVRVPPGLGQELLAKIIAGDAADD